MEKKSLCLSLPLSLPLPPLHPQVDPHGYGNSPEALFGELIRRRNAILKLLTTGEDLEKLNQERSIGKERISLLGFSEEDRPAQLAKPLFAICIPCDLSREEWLQTLATQCDAWLYAFTFYHATKCGFNKAERATIFQKLHNLQSVCDLIVNGDQNPKHKKDCHSQGSSGREAQHEGAANNLVQDNAGALAEDEVTDEDLELDQALEDKLETCGLCRDMGIEPGDSWFICRECGMHFHRKCGRYMIDGEGEVPRRIRGHACSNCVKPLPEDRVRTVYFH